MDHIENETTQEDAGLTSAGASRDADNQEGWTRERALAFALEAARGPTASTAADHLVAQAEIFFNFLTERKA